MYDGISFQILLNWAKFIILEFKPNAGILCIGSSYFSFSNRLLLTRLDNANLTLLNLVYYLTSSLGNAFMFSSASCTF